MPLPADLSDEFNRRLGNFTGRRARPTTASDVAVNAGVRRQLSLADALANFAKDRMQNPQPRREASSPLAVGNFSQDRMDTILAAQEALGGGWKDTLKDFGSGVGKVFDILARPAYATTEGLKEIVESRNEGQNLLESADDFVGGLWSGLSGKEKTSFFDIMEENSQFEGSKWTDPWSLINNLNPLTSDLPFEATAKLGELAGIDVPDYLKQNPLNPATSGRGITKEDGFSAGEQIFSNVAGIGGSLAYDPLNVVGGGVGSRVTGKASKGVDFALDSMKARVAHRTDQALSSHGLKKVFDRVRPPKGSLGEGLGAGRPVPVGQVELSKVIDEAIDNAYTQVNAGVQAGRVLGVETAPYTISTKVTEKAREFVFSNIDDNAQKIINHFNGTSVLTPAQIKTLSKDPQVEDLFNLIYNKNLKAAGATSLEDLLNPDKLKKLTSARRSQIVRDAMEELKSTYDKTFRDIQQELFDDLYGAVYNAPGIKVAGKTVANFDRMGKAYAKVKAKHLQGDGFRNLSYNKMFPGRTSLISQRVKSVGNAAYENYREGVRRTVKNLALTKDERKAIFTHVIKDTDPGDPRLREAKEFIQREFHDMFMEEMNMGIRSSGKMMAPNYVYAYYKPTRGAKRNAIDDMRQEVQEYIQKHGRLPDDLLERASRRNLTVQQDVFRALLLRKMESNRLKTRIIFAEDLLDQYGFMAKNLSPKAARDRELTLITPRGSAGRGKKAFAKDSQFAKQLTDSGGGNWYLPDDIAHVYDEFVKLLDHKVGKEAQTYLRTVDHITRLFKSSATIPYPGFHIRNFLGDIFMSTMDGVKASDYTATWKYGRAHSDGTKELEIGKVKFTWGELRKLFKETASSGTYHSADLGDLGTGTVSGITPNRAWNKLNEASQNREDFFRFTHFYSAFKDEFPKLMAQRGMTKERAIKKAAEVATYRVNKYLFDYGALTRLEKNVLRRIIPFYTYARKVMPTLTEAMWLNPGRMSKVQRIFMADQSDDQFNDLLIPDFRREIGYAKLTRNVKEPWILGGQFLPTEVLRSNTDISDIPAFLRNFLAQTNPVGKTAIELAAGKSMFNEREAAPNTEFFTQALLPPVQPTLDALGLIPGMDEKLESIPGINPSNKNDIERFFAGRFGLGLPVSQVDEKEQEGSLYDHRFNLRGALEKINNSGLEEKGYRVILSERSSTGNASFRIIRMSDGKVIANRETLPEILELVDRI